MYIEVSYGITSELYSSCDYYSRYPHRKFFETREELNKWVEEMEEKYGENGWRLGDENVHQGEFPQIWKERKAKMKGPNMWYENLWHEN